MTRARPPLRLLLLPEPRLVSGTLEVSLGPRKAQLLLALTLNGTLTVDDMMEMLWPHPDDMPDCWYPAITQWMVRLNRTLAPFGWTLQVRPRRGCGWRLVPYQKEHDMSRREDQALAMLRARRFCTPLEIGRAATRGEVRANRLTNTDRQRIGLEVIAVLLKAGKVKVARNNEVTLVT